LRFNLESRDSEQVLESHFSAVGAFAHGDIDDTKFPLRRGRIVSDPMHNLGCAVMALDQAAGPAGLLFLGATRVNPTHEHGAKNGGDLGKRKPKNSEPGDE
jgi:hypothetical protein